MVTPAPDFLRACAEAVEELRAARKVIAARNLESRLLAEMLDLEREISAVLKKKDALSESHVKQLENALKAKDRVIAAYEAEIVVLKKNRWTFWKAAKTAAVGAAAGIVIGAVLINR